MDYDSLPAIPRFLEGFVGLGSRAAVKNQSLSAEVEVAIAIAKARSEAAFNANEHAVGPDPRRLLDTIHKATWTMAGAATEIAHPRGAKAASKEAKDAVAAEKKRNKRSSSLDNAIAAFERQDKRLRKICEQNLAKINYGAL